MRLPRKPFLFGFVVGVLFLFVLEAGSVIGLAFYGRKTSEQVAERLVSPSIPSTVDAEFNFELKTLDGEAFEFAQLRGSTIFLSFWNPECVSCRAELPTIQSLFEQTRTDGVAFVLAALAGKEKEAASVMEEYRLSVPIYVLQGECPPVYLTHTVPVAYIITPEGKIAFKHEGPARWDDETTVAYLRGMTHAHP